jgi:hypothetical protein
MIELPKVKSVTEAEAVAAGFNFQGTCDDVAMLPEIQRGYLASGYSEIVFSQIPKQATFKYWTKHPAINP